MIFCRARQGAHFSITHDPHRQTSSPNCLSEPIMPIRKQCYIDTLIRKNSTVLLFNCIIQLYNSIYNCIVSKSFFLRIWRVIMSITSNVMSRQKHTRWYVFERKEPRVSATLWVRAHIDLLALSQMNLYRLFPLFYRSRFRGLIRLSGYLNLLCK